MKKKTLPYIYKTLSDSLKLTPNSSSDDVTEQDRHEDDATHPHRMVQLEEIKESEKQKLLPKGETTPKPFKDKMRIRFDIGRAFARQTLREIRKNKVSYLLGFMACFVVVLVVSLLLTILSNTPVVFLRLSELMAGEIDVQVQPEWPYSLNYNTFSSILTNPDFQYNSPRISGTINFYPTSQCEMEYNFDYDKDVIHCSGDNYRSYLYLIDSEKEKNMGLGRNWNLPPLGNAEIYLSSQTAKDIGVSKGQQVYLAVDLTSFLWIPYTHIETNATATPIWGSTLLLLTVKDTYSDPLGKYPQRYSRGAIMEYSMFLDTVLGQIGTLLSPSELAHTQQIDLYDYANQIIVNLPPQDRMAFYISSDYDQIQSNVVSFASNVMYDVGFNVASTRLQIVRYLKTYNILNLFLGLIINVIICILLFISTLLVYSLLVTNVESRTFEIGITRMFGMKRVEVIVMLMFQAFSYIVFSWPLGILASQGLAIYLSSAFEGLVSIKIDPKLTGDAIALSAIIGLIMPLFASIFPIRNALGHNLHDALDTRQSKTKAISISISRAESEVFSWSWIIVGGGCSLFGFSIYYLLPLSLITMDLALLLYIFVFLLLAMLLGATTLSLNLSNSLERILVNLLFFWDNSAVLAIVKKNFVAHRMRNRKTTILYAVSLAFIVFITVSYSIQLQSFLYQQQQTNGCYLKVTTSGDNPWTQQRNSIVTVDQFEMFASSHPDVLSWGWITHPLNSLSKVTGIEASNVGHVFKAPINIYGVSPELFNATIDGFLEIEEFDSAENYLGLLQSLYTINGSHSGVMGTSYMTKIGVQLESPFLVNLHTNGLYIPDDSDNNDDDDQPVTTSFSAGDVVNMKRMTSLAFLNAAPAFKFSKFPTLTAGGQDFMVSFTTYVRLSEGQVPGIDALPLRDFIIKLKPSLTSSQIDTIKDSLQLIVNANTGASIWDYRDTISTIEQISLILSYFFDFTTIIAMCVCYFSLNSSMYTNVYEQTKEIGILRSIGVSKFQMYRVYIYESLVLVLSSSLLGTLIGCFVGYTMVLQRALFTQLPIPFVFPWGIMIVVAAFSFGCSVLASFGPIRFLLRKSVVSVMRMT